MIKIVNSHIQNPTEAKTDFIGILPTKAKCGMPGGLV